MGFGRGSGRGFSGGSSSSRGRGSFGGGSGGRGGSGGFRRYDDSAAASSEIVAMGEYMHSSEGDMVIKSTSEKIPYFNAPIYLSNKSVIGKVDEILGPINQVYFTVKIQDGIVANSYKAGDKVFIGSDKLLPLERFLPKPKAPAVKKTKKKSSSRGGGGTSCGRGGLSSFSNSRGGNRGGRGGRGAPRGGGGRGSFNNRGGRPSFGRGK